MSRSRLPGPGQPVRGSTTGRPVMAALDLLGRRWSLRVLWELRDGAVGARALLERCDGLSSSVLYQRLRELTAAGLLEKDDGASYRLTLLGRDLGAALGPLDAWAHRWAERTDP
jgi:DNA-binding HxlR family transcriptional regulator